MLVAEWLSKFELLLFVCSPGSNSMETLIHLLRVSCEQDPRAHILVGDQKFVHFFMLFFFCLLDPCHPNYDHK